MDECPFLTTYDNCVECFKGCALYNYKETGGVCPFKKISQYTVERVRDRDDLIQLYERDFSFIRSEYFKENNQYF